VVKQLFHNDPVKVVMLGGNRAVDLPPMTELYLGPCRSHRSDWAALGAQNLARAYGDDEPNTLRQS
jgi:hypothetical protein